MKKSNKDIIVILLVIGVIVACSLLGNYVLKKTNKNLFISRAKELYSSALKTKEETDYYFDSKSKNELFSILNYHIEFDEDKITHFLVYNDKLSLELESENIKLEDINEKNIIDYSDDIVVKHNKLNDNYHITYDKTSNQHCFSYEKGNSESEEEDKYVYTISMGYAPNGCYNVEITDVKIDEQLNATLYVKYTYPTPEMICTQAITYPCASITFSKKPNSITLVKESNREEKENIDGKFEEMIK